jgi:hypothetical protein
VEQIIKALPTILRAGANSAEVVEAAAISAWKYVAGEPLSKHAVATKLTARTLAVLVSDAIWQKQLESMRRSLVFRLNAVLGQPLVSRLEFRIDAGSVCWAVDNASTRAKPNESSENGVSLELYTAANAIRDKRLRKIFLAAAASRLRHTEQ